MIKIINLTHPKSALSETLKTLDSNIQTLELDLQEFQMESRVADIIIIPTKVLSKIEPFRLSSMKVIVWVEPNDDVLNMYSTIKDKDVSAVISAQNLSKLDQIILQTYEELLVKKQKFIQSSQCLQVISFKGGVGTTFIAHHLADQLSQLSRNSTLYIDSAKPFGSTKGTLNLESEYSWKTLQPSLSGKNQLGSNRLKSISLATKYQFDILSYPVDFEGTELNVSEHAQLTQLAKQSYALTIEDRGAILKKTDVEFLQEADLICVVLTPDPSSIYNTYIGLEFIRTQLSKDMNILGIVNMFESKEDRQVLTQLKEKFNLQYIDKVEMDSEAVRHFSRRYELVTDKSLVIYEDLKRISEEVFKKMY